MPKSEQEINAEKAAKPRPDLIPGTATLAEGAVDAYGFFKHGPCTWKIAGTEQADPQTHIASACRHIAEYLDNQNAVESGSGLPVLWHARAQLGIAIDCIARLDRAAFDRQLAGLAPVLVKLAAAKHSEEDHTNGCTERCTVGSAFAAGAIEGEDPIMGRANDFGRR